ncbi:MAG: hypothetical protein KGJ59_05030 [Bacteroidota bacterium]|nr:hypothetical protein [Bacteroidota bacterium]
MISKKINGVRVYPVMRDAFSQRDSFEGGGSLQKNARIVPVQYLQNDVPLEENSTFLSGLSGEILNNTQISRRYSQDWEEARFTGA